MLVLTALWPLLEYSATVLVPTREHARALESGHLKVAHMILGCPSETSSDVTRASLGQTWGAPFELSKRHRKAA